MDGSLDLMTVLEIKPSLGFESHNHESFANEGGDDDGDNTEHIPSQNPLKV